MVQIVDQILIFRLGRVKGIIKGDKEDDVILEGFIFSILYWNLVLQIFREYGIDFLVVFNLG